MLPEMQGGARVDCEVMPQRDRTCRMVVLPNKNMVLAFVALVAGLLNFKQ